jgi:hypothetical protein
MKELKKWAVTQVQLKVTGWKWHSYPYEDETSYDCFLEPTIVKLFETQQEAIDYLTKHSKKLSEYGIATIVEVKDITEEKNRPRY